MAELHHAIVESRRMLSEPVDLMKKKDSERNESRWRLRVGLVKTLI